MLNQKHFMMKCQMWCLIIVLATLSVFCFPQITFAAENNQQTQELSGESSSNLQIQSEIPDVEDVIVSEIYHHHTGSNGSGCYSAPIRCGGGYETTTGIECRCGPNANNGYCCPDHGCYFEPASDYYPSGCAHCYCPVVTKRYCSKCGATDGSGVCDKVVGYGIGCGLQDGQKMGSIKVTRSTTNWTKSLTLQATYQNISNMNISSKPYIWNGVASTNDTLLVDANGEYTFQLGCQTIGNNAGTSVKVSVTNIDNTAPQIGNCNITPNGWVTDIANVTLENITDAQPSGGMGSGLSSQPYSYDGGSTWVETAMCTQTNNGTYEALVRDQVGNIAVVPYAIKNIDNTPPTIIKLEYDNTPNLSQTEITVEAKDLQQDGTEGAGLAENPYSFDQGQTWTKEKTHTVTDNGTYEVWVKDILDQVAKATATVETLDLTGPKLTHVVSPDGWAKPGVTVTVTVEDLNDKGEPGIGVPKEYLKWNGEEEWTDVCEKVVDKNGQITVVGRDIYGNETEYSVDISNIDSLKPEVSLTSSKRECSSGETATLTVAATDIGSGLADKPYSYDDGVTFIADPTYVVTGPGEYKVCVRDKVGNCAYATVVIDPVIVAPEPEVTEPQPIQPDPTDEGAAKPEPDKLPPINLDITKVEPTKLNNVKKEEHNGGEEDWEVAIEELDELEEVVELEENQSQSENQVVDIKEQDGDKGFWDIVSVKSLVSLLLAFLLFGLLWLLFTLYRSAKIYCCINDDEMQYLGRERLHREEDYETIMLCDMLLDMGTTTSYAIVPSKWFVKNHRDKNLVIIFDDDTRKNRKIKETIIVERKEV